MIKAVYIVAWNSRRRVMTLQLLFLVLLASLFPSLSTSFCPSRYERQRAKGIFNSDDDDDASSIGSTRLKNNSRERRLFQTHLSASPSSSSSSSSISDFLSLPPKDDDGDESKWKKCHAESNFWRSVYKKVDANEEEDGGDDDNNGMMLSPLTRELPSVATLDFSGPLPLGAYFYRSTSNNNKVSSSGKPTCRISLAIDMSSSSTDNTNNVELDASEMVQTMQSCLEDGLSSFQLLTTSTTSSFTTEEQQQWVEENVYQRLLAETPAFALSQCHLTIPFFLQQHGRSTTSSTTSRKLQQRPSTTPNMSMLSTQKLLRQHVAESLLRMGGAESIDCLQLIEPQDQTADVNHLYHLDVLEAVQDLQREGLVQSVSLVPSRYSVENQASLAWKTRGSTSTTLWSNNIVDSIQMPVNLLETDDALAFYTFLEQQQQQHVNNNNNEKRLMPAILASSPLADGFLTDRYVHEESENLSLQFLGSERFAFEEYIGATMMASSASTIISKDEMTSLWNHYQSKLLPALTDIAWKHGVTSVSCVSLRWLLQAKNNHVASAVVPTSLMEANDYYIQGYDSYMKRNGRFRQRRPKSLYKQLRDLFTFQLDEEDLDRLAQLSQDFTALKPGAASRRKNKDIAFDPMHAEWQQEDPESYFREVIMENGGGGDYDIDFKNPKLWL